MGFSRTALNNLRKTYGYTHIGIREEICWGVSFPDPDLHIAHFDPWFGVDWYIVDRETWEQLTSSSPPWPWLDDGTGMAYDKTWCFDSSTPDIIWSPK